MRGRAQCLHVNLYGLQLLYSARNFGHVFLMRTVRTYVLHIYVILNDMYLFVHAARCMYELYVRRYVGLCVIGLSLRQKKKIERERE